MHVTLDRFGITLLCLSVACAFFARVHRRILAAEVETYNVSDDFWRFQRNYLIVYLLCSFSDWLKGPYVYALYEYYGFDGSAIAWLFIGGYLSSMVFGTVAGALSDRFGRRLMCRVFCIVYACSALTKVFNSFPILLFGRILSGIATSLLFTTFEAWMVSEHHSRGYPAALLTHTFSTATILNGFGAVTAGIVAQVAASSYGYAAPFLVAVPTLAAAGLFTYNWPENYGDSQMRAWESLSRGWSAIATSRKLKFLGACESLYEGALYIWVFYWTPSISTLDERGTTPLGIAFACFMASLMIGGTIPHIWSIKTVAKPLHLTTIAAIGLSGAFFDSKLVVFLSFVLFEGCVGAYFPTHGTLRSMHIEEGSRASVMNIFRVPLNAFVIVALQIEYAPRVAMGLLAVAYAGSLYCLRGFNAAVSVEQKLEASEML